LTPDKGAFHSVFFGTKDLRDRDPERLLARPFEVMAPQFQTVY
jgi:hypothetical protein